MRYRVVYADPPWTFATYSAKGKGKSPERHYQCLTLPEIKALPVAELAADDCALFLWVTMPTLPQGLEVIRSWGFTYKSRAFCWAKLTRTGKQWHFGCGYSTRKNPEDCLLATRGRPRVLDRGVPELIVAPVREHSRKPDEARQRIERLFAGPRVELFARQRWPGWEVRMSDQPEHFAEVTNQATL
jgi:N6-adenosine-specific RNA methylase IME4